MITYEQYKLNNLEIMEGINFKANKEKQLLKDKIKKANKKRETKETIMFTILITIFALLVIMLINKVTTDYNTTMENCTKNHSRLYCEEHM